MPKFKIKAWLLQEPPPQHAVPQEFEVDTYKLRVFPDHASGALDLIPPAQTPISIAGLPGHFSRVEIYTTNDKLWDTIIVERGQLSRYPAPWHQITAERLGQFGQRESVEFESESVVFEPITVTGEGFVRLISPAGRLRVAADAYLSVRVRDPNGAERAMEYSDGTVVVRKVG